MPELPEVETIKRGLEGILGQRIRRVVVTDSMLLVERIDEVKLRETLEGTKITNLERVGKYCLIQSDSWTLLFSLRMTGNLRVADAREIERDNFVQFVLQDASLWFTTVRRFSRVHCYETIKLDTLEKVERLGVDPLRTTLDKETLQNRFVRRTAPVKNALMNQEIIAGLGNIYANEICHVVGIDPRRGVNKLRDSEVEALSDCIPSLLERAIEHGGSSLRDFSAPDGNPGEFQNEFFVYDRDGNKCASCSTLIKKTVLAGRSTFWCPNCQN